MSKFAEIFACLIIVCVGSGFLVLKSTNEFLLACGDFDSHSPQLSFAIPRDAFISGHVPLIFKFVLSILLLRAFAQVMFTIVERIPVFMVYLETSPALLQNQVHINQSWSRGWWIVVASCIIFSIGSFFVGKPQPLRQMGKIFFINNGNLALRQWNESERLVKRLSNFNSLKFWHGPTANGIVLLSRYSMNEV